MGVKQWEDKHRLPLENLNQWDENDVYPKNLCKTGAHVFRVIFHMFLLMCLDCVVKSYMLVCGKIIKD